MNIDRAVFALAGTLSLLGAVLAAAVSPWWLLLVAFVGVNQVQASVTGICPAASILGRLGVPVGCAFKVGTDDSGQVTQGPGAADLHAVD